MIYMPGKKNRGYGDHLTVDQNLYYTTFLVCTSSLSSLKNLMMQLLLWTECPISYAKVPGHKEMACGDEAFGSNEAWWGHEGEACMMGLVT